MVTIEVLGPKVSVTRAGTADRGAGQLVIAGNTLVVRIRHIERRLGPLSGLEEARLLDLGRKQAELRFQGFVVWELESEEDDLYGFLQQLAAAAGRPSLLTEPPRLSQRVREIATPHYGRWVAATLIALALVWPLRLLCATSGLLASAVTVLGGLGLLASVAALALGPESPWLQTLRRRIERLGRVPVLVFSFALSLALALAGLLGGIDYRVSAHQASVDQAMAERAAATARADAERSARLQREQQARVTATVSQLKRALEEKKYREAATLREALREQEPKHPMLAAIASDLDTKLAQLDEHDRQRGLQLALRAVKRMAKDPIACETFSTVADAWVALRKVRASDPEREQAVRAIPTLERCRSRVRERVYQSMLAAARQEGKQLEPDKLALTTPVLDKAGMAGELTLPD